MPPNGRDNFDHEQPQPRQLRGLVRQEYKYGFYTDVETDSAPPGLSEDTIRLISRQEERAGVADRVAAQGVSPLADDAGADLAEGSSPKRSITRTSFITPRRRRRATGRKASRRWTRNCWRPTRSSAFRCANASGSPAWPWTRCLTAFPSGRRSRNNSREKGIIFCSFSEAVQEHPDLVRKYLGMVVPYTDNFFAALNSAVFTRRLVLLHPERRALPDGAFDLFPHQRRQHRPVRAHAHRRR